MVKVSHRPALLDLPDRSCLPVPHFHGVPSQAYSIYIRRRFSAATASKPPKSVRSNRTVVDDLKLFHFFGCIHFFGLGSLQLHLGMGAVFTQV